MAVNEKAVYATQYTTHAGKVYAPGEQLTGSMPDHAVHAAADRGLTTDSHADAQRAQGAEQERQRQVAREQETRTEKREPEERADRR